MGTARSWLTSPGPTSRFTPHPRRRLLDWPAGRTVDQVHVLRHLRSYFQLVAAAGVVEVDPMIGMRSPSTAGVCRDR